MVSPGQKIKIEKINKKQGEEVVFDEVLLLEKNKKMEVGAPFVDGAKVVGKILSHGKGKKVIIFKYRAKTRYKVKKGHRQPYTEVLIEKLDKKD